MKLTTVGTGKSVHVFMDNEAAFARDTACGAARQNGNIAARSHRPMHVFEGAVSEVTCKRCQKSEAYREAEQAANSQPAATEDTQRVSEERKAQMLAKMEANGLSEARENARQHLQDMVDGKPNLSETGLPEDFELKASNPQNAEGQPWQVQAMLQATSTTQEAPAEVTIQREFPETVTVDTARGPVTATINMIGGGRYAIDYGSKQVATLTPTMYYTSVHIPETREKYTMDYDYQNAETIFVKYLEAKGYTVI